MTRETIPYHIRGLEANDMLYGCDPSFVAEVNSVASAVLQQILRDLAEMEAGPRRAAAANELLLTAQRFADSPELVKRHLQTLRYV